MARASHPRVPTLRRSARTHEKALGGLGITVWGADGMTLEELIAAEPELAERNMIAATTAGRLREAGFEPAKTGRPNHYTVYLPDLFDVTLERLIEAFDPAVPNPLLGQSDRI